MILLFKKLSRLQTFGESLDVNYYYEPSQQEKEKQKKKKKEKWQHTHLKTSR